MSPDSADPFLREADSSLAKSHSPGASILDTIAIEVFDSEKIPKVAALVRMNEAKHGDTVG